MAYRRFSTHLIAACLVTTCLGYNAYASEPTLYFYPAQKWSVSETGGTTHSPVCTISNTFNNGFGIEISGTAKGFSSLNVDFRQSSFEVGKRYEVVFSVPGQAKEIVMAKAGTGSLLSSDISSRDGFSQALEDAATLDMSIQGNAFRLYLTGVAQGLSDFENCVSPASAVSAAVDEVANPQVEALKVSALPEPQEIPKESSAASDKTPSITPIVAAKTEPYDAATPPEPVTPPAAPVKKEEPKKQAAAPSDPSLPSSEGKRKEVDDVVAQATSLAERYEASRAESPSSTAPLPLDEDLETASNDAFFDVEEAVDAKAQNAASKETQKSTRYTEELNKQISEKSALYKPEEKKAIAPSASKAPSPYPEVVKPVAASSAPYPETVKPVAVPASVSPSPYPEVVKPAAVYSRGSSGDVLKTKDDVIYFGAKAPPAQQGEKGSAQQVPAAAPSSPANESLASSSRSSEGIAPSAPAPMPEPAAGPEPMPKAEPKHVSATIPAYKMTQQTASLEADLTSVGLPQAQTPMPETAAGGMERMAMASAALEPSSGQAGEDFLQMRDRIHELEKKVSSLSKENEHLDNELKSSLQDAEQERLSVSSDNWNLERATMRYNEAERQLQRLGRQLQSARQECTSEKQKLETMLFDPQLTEQQQLSKLSDLEDKLARTKEELDSAQRRYEERIRILESQLAAQ